MRLRSRARLACVAASCLIVGAAAALAPDSAPKPGPLGKMAPGAADARNASGPSGTEEQRLMRPSPFRAHADKPRIADHGCIARPEVERPFYCVYGSPRARNTVVLVGDSHAAQLFPALDRIREHRPWRIVVFTKVGCPPFDQLVRSARLNRAYHECEVFREHALQRIERIRPELVVTAGWIWHMAMLDDGFGFARDSAHNRRLLAQGYHRAVERIARTGARVAVMRDTPTAPHNVPNCLRDPEGDPYDVDRCGFRLEANYFRQSFEARVARRVEGASLVNLVNLMCPARLCSPVIDGRLVYRDRLHLTATYARSLAQPLGRRLTRLP